MKRLSLLPSHAGFQPWPDVSNRKRGVETTKKEGERLTVLCMQSTCNVIGGPAVSQIATKQQSTFDLEKGENYARGATKSSFSFLQLLFLSISFSIEPSISVLFLMAP